MSNMDNLVNALAAATDGDAGVVAPPPAKKARTGGKSKQDRLEQNRKAAIESRRRKKVMVSCVKLGHWAARTCLVMRLLLTTMGMTAVLYSALSVVMIRFILLTYTREYISLSSFSCVGRRTQEERPLLHQGQHHPQGPKCRPGATAFDGKANHPLQ